MNFVLSILVLAANPRVTPRQQTLEFPMRSIAECKAKAAHYARTLEAAGNNVQKWECLPKRADYL